MGEKNEIGDIAEVVDGIGGFIDIAIRVKDSHYDPDHLEIFTKDAESGNMEAQYRLGYSYRWGRNRVRKNRALGVKWLREAAKQGHADAQYELGRCYRHGKGIAKNKATAYEWYKKAAAQGHKKAKEKLDDLD
jgi:hypothetical protein